MPGRPRWRCWTCWCRCSPPLTAAKSRAAIQHTLTHITQRLSEPRSGRWDRRWPGVTAHSTLEGGSQHRRNAFVARRRALLPGRIRAERACGATGKTTFEDSYDRGGGAVPTMWAGGVACPSGPSRPVSGGRAATFHAARQPKRSIHVDLAHWIPKCPAGSVAPAAAAGRRAAAWLSC